MSSSVHFWYWSGKYVYVAGSDKEGEKKKTREGEIEKVREKRIKRERERNREKKREKESERKREEKEGGEREIKKVSKMEGETDAYITRWIEVDWGIKHVQCSAIQGNMLKKVILSFIFSTVDYHSNFFFIFQTHTHENFSLGNFWLVRGDIIFPWGIFLM